VARPPTHQGDDAVELPVREAELAVERLFHDRAQDASLAGGCDGPSTVAP
jgi:hypothetical protein